MHGIYTNTTQWRMLDSPDKRDVPVGSFSQRWCPVRTRYNDITEPQHVELFECGSCWKKELNWPINALGDCDHHGCEKHPEYVIKEEPPQKDQAHFR
jgi:hypothetical protein